MGPDRARVCAVLMGDARDDRCALLNPVPAEQWRNVDTGEVLKGGRRLDAPAPLEVSPVFERMD